jgi:phenylacetate-CoA ligase
MPFDDQAHYDALETRAPEARERDLFGRLPHAIAHAMTAPGWARHLAGVDARAITSRAALAQLPLLRKSDLSMLQKASPPFAGFNVTPAAQARRLLMSPGPIFEPEHAGGDWWGGARVMFAAGFRPGDIVHNSFAYHLTPGGHMLDAAAHLLGCAVIPAGPSNTEQQIDAIAHLKPSGYVGTPDFLKILLDAAARDGKDASSLKRGLVSGAALPESLRQEFAERGVTVVQTYAAAEFGFIAYESAGHYGMILNEALILEIVRPGTGDPVPDGDVGEVVLTSLNPHYPLIRLATGDLSAVLTGASPCGRTNTRLKGWMGRADQTTKIKGMFVHPGQVAEIAKRHPALGRLRLVVTRDGEQDVMRLEAECAESGLEASVATTLQSVTKLRGAVQLVPPGTLPNDGKLIADERSYG